MKKAVQITINDRIIKADAGTTILQAALAAGISIPHLCHHPAISVIGACRICIVEVMGAKNLPASCTTPVAEGMVVKTESERVVRARKLILDLILGNHCVDCIVCEKNGDCRLQEYAYKYGVAHTSFKGARREYQKDDTNPFFIRDHSKCILCGRCLAMCAEKVCNHVYDIGYRGFEAKIIAGLDGPQEESAAT